MEQVATSFEWYYIFMRSFRILGLFVMFYQAVCRKRTKSISVKTQYVYAFIFSLEFVKAYLFESTTAPSKIILTSLYWSLTLLILSDVFSGDLINGELRHDTFSLFLLILLGAGSLGVSLQLGTDVKECLTIFIDCLSILAAIPQYYFAYKAKERATVINLYLGLLTFHHFLGIFEITTSGDYQSPEMYYLALYPGIALLVNVLCFFAIYPSRVAPTRARNERKKQVSNKRAHKQRHWSQNAAERRGTVRPKKSRQKKNF